MLAQRTKRETQRTKEQIKKAESLGIKDYIVRTSEDGRVCPECKNHENKKYPYKKVKIGVNILPFHDGCRCYAESIVSPKYYKEDKK